MKPIENTVVSYAQSPKLSKSVSFFNNTLPFVKLK